MKKSLEQRVKWCEQTILKLENNFINLDKAVNILSKDLYDSINFTGLYLGESMREDKPKDNTGNWITIDYTKIPKETFEKYGCKPFQIMERKMRNDKGEVWNNISFTDAKAEAEKLGYRLPSIQEMLVLLDVYKKEHPNDASIHHDEFLGIKELSYDESVYLEWIDAPSPVFHGGAWSGGSGAGAFTLSLDWGPGNMSTYVGFRMAR